MMFKRIVSFLSAVIVMTSSVFAWDAYSFTGVYDVASSAPALYADTSTQTSFDGQWMMQHLQYSGSASLICVYEFPGTDWPVETPSMSIPFLIPDPPVQMPLYKGNWSDTYWAYLDYTIDVPNSHNTWEVLQVGTLVSSVAEPDLSWFRFDLDISSLPEFYAFQFSGISGFYKQLYVGSQQLWDASGIVLEIYVNDTLQRTFTLEGDSLDYSDYLYSGSEPVTSIYFRVSFPPVYESYPEGQSSVSCRAVAAFGFSQSNFKFSILQVDDVLVGAVDQAQDDINSHESIESQWTGSMSSNFDALDMDSFSFPSGLLSGFSLITGIFQDLWNGMGDYKILYVFPLFLGIALLLIGRISKFSGGQSSSRSNRGDDDA